jgi:hypothetical protein
LLALAGHDDELYGIFSDEEREPQREGAHLSQCMGGTCECNRFFLAMICASVNTWFKLDDLGLPGYNMVKHIFQNSLQSLAYHSKSFPSI